MEKIETLLEENAIDSESIYNLLYKLHFYMALAEAEDDVKNGRVVTLEELKSEMEARYESYRNKQST